MVEYALHSLRIGDATFMSAARALADVVQREGRRKSDPYKGYVKVHGVDVKAVSDMPGQRTVWDINGNLKVTD